MTEAQRVEFRGIQVAQERAVMGTTRFRPEQEMSVRLVVAEATRVAYQLACVHIAQHVADTGDHVAAIETW